MWYEVIKGQTQCVNDSYEKYQQGNARYFKFEIT